MTNTKLEIIGPYTPEHEGPFCTREGFPARIICTDRKSHSNHLVVALIDDGDQEHICIFDTRGAFCSSDRIFDLMNAREVPVAREFWVNEYAGVVPKNAVAHRDERDARSFENDPSYIRTIHVREVLPGDGHERGT